jgi:hypothetical protein
LYFPISLSSLRNRKFDGENLSLRLRAWRMVARKWSGSGNVEQTPVKLVGNRKKSRIRLCFSLWVFEDWNAKWGGERVFGFYNRWRWRHSRK